MPKRWWEKPSLRWSRRCLVYLSRGWSKTSPTRVCAAHRSAAHELPSQKLQIRMSDSASDYLPSEEDEEPFIDGIEDSDDGSSTEGSSGERIFKPRN